MWALFVISVIAAASAIPDNLSSSSNAQTESVRNSMIADRLASRFEDRLKKQCKRYGDKDSFDNVTNVTKIIGNTLQEAATQQLAPYIQSGVIPDPMKIICKLSPLVKEGASRLVAALKPCTNPGSQTALEHVTNITESVLVYLCYNDGQRVKSFIDEGGVECYKHRLPEVLQCAEPAVSGEESDTESSEDSKITSSNETFVKEDKETKLAKNCREATTLRTCVKRELDQCSKSSSSSFVAGLLDSVFTPICLKYINN